MAARVAKGANNSGTVSGLVSDLSGL